MFTLCHGLFAGLLLVCQLQAGDWPQFLGPARDGSHEGPVLKPDWDKDEPRTLWRKSADEGFAAPIAVDGKVILFHRRANDEMLSCFDAATGSILWESKYPATYRDDMGFEEGPRATPCVSDGKVFSLGADGAIQAVGLTDGRQLWSVNARKEWNAGKGFFGIACSPLVHRGMLLLNIGGENAGIVALDCETGKLKWKATNHEASYSSPVVAPLEGRDVGLFFTRGGLLALEPADGRVIAEFPWRSRSHASVNAATPLVIESAVFISASYDTGAVLLDWNGGKLKKVWAADGRLSNHYATSVHHDGHLYGFDGRQEFGMSFVCVEARTGREKWRKERFGAGTVTLLKSGPQLLILKESGQLVLAEASPERWKQLSQVQILGSTVRAYPALANSVLYARDQNRLIAVALPVNVR